MANVQNKMEQMLLYQYDSYLKENEKFFERNAIKKKFFYSNCIEKIKLIIKLILRVFGVKFDMRLERFREDVELRQTIQDLCTYVSLMRNDRSEADICIKDKVEISENSKDKYLLEGKVEEKLKQEISEKKSYLAFMVENLNEGGLEEVVKLLVVECSRRNLELKVFCTQWGGKIAEELQKKGIEVVVFGKKKAQFEKYISQNRPLLINSHYVVDFIDIIAKYQIPMVEVIHNMYVFLPKQRLIKEQQKVECVSEYIAVSNAAARIFLEKVHMVCEERMHIIGNTGKSNEQIVDSREHVREYYKIPSEAYVFLVAGTIDARKNQLGILRAWNIVTRLVNRKIALVMAGTCGDYDYKDMLQSYIKQWKLNDSVYMLGHCEQIYDLMNACDALIVDSYYEGWSMAATEALYSGLPLIHSQCGSGLELIAGGQNGVLISNPLKDIEKYSPEELELKMRSGENDNIRELVIAVLKLLQNQEVYKRDIIKSFAKEKFSVDEMLNAYIKVFYKACKSE